MGLYLVCEHNRSLIVRQAIPAVLNLKWKLGTKFIQVETFKEIVASYC